MGEEEQNKYTPDYCHFDKLIWQVPAWASAIFAFTVVATGMILSNAANILCIFGISVKTLLSVFLLLIALILVLLSNVLYRFRLHQAYLHKDFKVPRCKYFPGAQRSLQVIIALECAALLVTFFLMLNSAIWRLISILLTLSLLAFCLNRIEKEIKKIQNIYNGYKKEK
jgi:hypothetical protein